ncbi:uncharacterized protein LOC110862805 [Folsomia candida]|uniref:F-box domain-containing protein n=1 Tax=Folsomia candida TaxID=158441 RepID=A0A226CV67_FOLCA|nr:uncharacterized protein LOC110862805 [Folsomia candida]OXA36893.1 hypothetical protein Fcan01_28353 [Folsomia candida]
MGSAYYSMLPRGRFYPRDNHEKWLKRDIGKNEGNLDQHNFEEHYSPLRNLLIINKILDYLDPASTLSARLICSLWNSEICRRINGPKRSVLNYKTISRNIQHLKFSTHSELVELLKFCNSASRKFFVTSFYFKLLPKLSISMLGATTFSNFLQDSVTRVKIAVHTSHVSQWFDLLKKMRALKHLYIIRVPEFGRANFQDGGTYKLDSNYDDKNLILENLVTIKLQSLACSEHFFSFNDSDLNASLISFLKCTRTVKLLQFVGWPGKVVEVLDKVKVLGENLEILRISGGRKLGEEDVKVLTEMEFPAMKRIELNVLDEKRGGVGDHVWGKLVEKVGQKVRVVKIV